MAFEKVGLDLDALTILFQDGRTRTLHSPGRPLRQRSYQGILGIKVPVRVVKDDSMSEELHTGQFIRISHGNAKFRVDLQCFRNRGKVGLPIISLKTGAPRRVGLLIDSVSSQLYAGPS